MGDSLFDLGSQQSEQGVQRSTVALDFAPPVGSIATPTDDGREFQPLVRQREPGDADSPDQPDYLPARMLNEFVYCPRLFYYEWVEGVFVNSVDTVAGSLRHQKLERKEDALPAAEDLIATQDKIHSRSVQLASDTHRLIAKLDLIEGEGDLVVPVDYKIGKPRQDSDKGELSAWDTDRVQLAAQGLVLRENGYRCEEGVIYYVATKQRVRVPLGDELIAFTLDALKQAREAAFGPIPPPLVDSPMCARCSLVGIRTSRGAAPLKRRQDRRLQGSLPRTHVDADACASRFGISKRHWLRLTDGGKAPLPVRLGRLVRWSISTLEEWERGGCKPIRQLGRSK